MFISFLGIGQGGSNIVEEASKRGFYSAVMNYSSVDLKSLIHVEKKLQLIGSEGVGKQRQEAIKLLDSNWDLATNFVKENFSHPSIQIIIVPFSTGGGTGSGVAPVLLNILNDMMPEKTFVAMPIIPSLDESYRSQTNCLETFQDLSQLDVAILPIDNEQSRTISTNIGKSQMYSKINNKVIDLIQKILEYTEHESSYSVFDKKDLLAIFKTKGVMIVSEIESLSLSNGYEESELSFANKIQKSWNDSPFAQIENEQIISAGIIFDGDENMLNSLNMSKIFSIFNNKMPLNLYEGYYSSNKNTLISILGGLSLCKTRLSKIENVVVKYQEKIPTRIGNSAYVSNVNLDRFEIDQQQKTKPTIKDISSIINKFKR